MMQPVQSTQETLEIISSYLQRLLLSNREDQEIDPLTSAIHNVLAIPDFDAPKFAKIFQGFPLDLQVLVWHIITEIYFRYDSSTQHHFHPHQEMEACKYLSNYMMHTMVMRQIMKIRENSFFFWNAIEEIIRFSHSGDITHPYLVMPNENVENPIDDNLIKIGQMFARRMLTINDQENRWKLITKVWIELLIMEAKNSKASIYVKQLSLCEGDQLSTLIWLFVRNLSVGNVFTFRGSVDLIYEEANLLLSEIEHRNDVADLS